VRRRQEPISRGTANGGAVFHGHDGADVRLRQSYGADRAAPSRAFPPVATTAAKGLAALPNGGALFHGRLGRADARPSHGAGMFPYRHDGADGAAPSRAFPPVVTTAAKGLAALPNGGTPSLGQRRRGRSRALPGVFPRIPLALLAHLVFSPSSPASPSRISSPASPCAPSHVARFSTGMTARTSAFAKATA